MTSLTAKVSSTASAEVTPRRNPDAEIALRKVLSEWKSDFVADACYAATHLGIFHSGGWLGLERAKEILLEEFDLRKVDDIHWSTVHAAFQNGRDTVTTPAELRAKYLPVAVTNDNEFFEPTVFEWQDPSTIPLRDWIYGTHLLRGIVSMTIASGAVGKTSLKIVEALALATGRPLLGHAVPKRSRVWLFNLEDDLIELRRRVSAAMLHYNIKPDDIGDRLLIDGEKSLIITKTDHRSTTIREPVVNAVVEAIQALDIDVLIVDPFVSSHDAPENDSGAMDKVMKKGWVPVAREGKCAVDLCHHTTKVDAGTATAMSGRGSGASVAASRSVTVLNPMSADDAKKAGLESPAGYFSAINDKENLAPASCGWRVWYKMQSVSLGNGGKGNIAAVKSDQIGVVTRWDYPSNASFTEGVTDEQLQAIKNLLKIGEHRKDNQASDWAGYKVGQVLGLGSSKGAMQTHDRKRVTRMLDTWLESGELEVYRATVDRQKRQFLRTA
jgi:hypothetical protein